MDTTTTPAASAEPYDRVTEAENRIAQLVGEVSAAHGLATTAAAAVDALRKLFDPKGEHPDGLAALIIRVRAIEAHVAKAAPVIDYLADAISQRERAALALAQFGTSPQPVHLDGAVATPDTAPPPADAPDSKPCPDHPDAAQSPNGCTAAGCSFNGN